MYGWRGKIGLIVPAAGPATPVGEFRKLLPEGVVVIQTLVPAQEISEQELSTRYDENIEKAASLLSMSDVGIIVQAGTPVAQYVKGQDEAIIRRIEAVSHLPAVATVTCVINALRKLGVKKLAIGAAYPEQVTSDLAKLLETRGFDVVSTKSLNIRKIADVARLSPTDAYRVGKDAFLGAPECEGLFVSCGAMPVADIIEKLEKDIQKPVVTTNSAIAWECLKRLSVMESIPGYGRLLRSF